MAAEGGGGGGGDGDKPPLDEESIARVLDDLDLFYATEKQAAYKSIFEEEDDDEGEEEGGGGEATAGIGNGGEGGGGGGGGAEGGVSLFALAANSEEKSAARRVAIAADDDDEEEEELYKGLEEAVAVANEEREEVVEEEEEVDFDVLLLEIAREKLKQQEQEQTRNVDVKDDVAKMMQATSTQGVQFSLSLAMLNQWNLDAERVEAATEAATENEDASGAVLESAPTAAAAAAEVLQKTSVTSSSSIVHYFFYGSLRKDKRNHFFLNERLEGAKFIGTFVSVDCDFHLIGLKSLAYPFLTRASPMSSSSSSSSEEEQGAECAFENVARLLGPKSHVVGEVYGLKADDERGIAALDLLESGYSKREIMVSRIKEERQGQVGERDEEETPLKAFVYLKEDGIEEIWTSFEKRYIAVPDGDWSLVGK